MCNTGFLLGLINCQLIKKLVYLQQMHNTTHIGSNRIGKFIKNLIINWSGRSGIKGRKW